MKLYYPGDRRHKVQLLLIPRTVLVHCIYFIRYYQSQSIYGYHTYICNNYTLILSSYHLITHQQNHFFFAFSNPSLLPTKEEATNANEEKVCGLKSPDSFLFYNSVDQYTTQFKITGCKEKSSLTGRNRIRAISK